MIDMFRSAAAATLVDVVLIDGRSDPSETMLRLRAMIAGSISLRQVIHDGSSSTDEHFDPHHHVRLETLPDPRSVRELKRLATRLLEDPFVANRPGWTIHVVGKVSRNRSAIIVRRLSEYDERVLGALAGNPVEPDATSETPRIDASRLLGLAQQLLAQPDPVNALVDRAASTVTRLMSQLERPDGARSSSWTNRSGVHDHQDLRVDHDGLRDEASRFGVDERALILTLLAETSSVLHQSSPTETLQCAVAMRRRDAGHPTTIALPTSAMPFGERLHAIQELLVHLPSRDDGLIDQVMQWVPPALTEARRPASTDLACVFAEPLVNLSAIGLAHTSTLPFVSPPNSAVTLIATVDGRFVRLGFAVDRACGIDATLVRTTFEDVVHAHLHVPRESRGFSRWWATLRKQSATT